MRTSESIREQVVLDKLKQFYQQQGYAFFVSPPRDILPAFLGTYRPDAVALKPEAGGVIIEVKAGLGAANGERQLERLAALASGHPDWEVRVVFADEVPEDRIKISPSRPAQIDAQIDEAAALISSGHITAAFLLAWAILEAVARSLRSRVDLPFERPFSAAENVQFLEMMGLLDPEVAKQLRAAVTVRNSLVHGDFSSAVDPASVTVLVEQLRILSDAARAPVELGKPQPERIA